MRLPLEIVIEGREDDKQLVIRDTGIGMTHDELVTNLGTIAHSGSADFLKAADCGEGGEVGHFVDRPVRCRLLLRIHDR